jgi:hypothetical protein
VFCHGFRGLNPRVFDVVVRIVDVDKTSGEARDHLPVVHPDAAQLQDGVCKGLGGDDARRKNLRVRGTERTNKSVQHTPVSVHEQ